MGPSSRRRHSQTFERAQWIAISLVGLLAVGAGTVSVVAITNQSGVTSTSAGTFVASTPPPVTRPIVRAYILGDSVTSGAGVGAGKGYPLTTDSLMNWNTTVDGVGGTGYIAKGVQPEDGGEVNDASFPTRIAAIADAAPDVVVVAGGRNDLYLPPAQVQVAVRSFYADLRQALPEARIVAVGPWVWNTSEEAKWRSSQETMSQSLAATMAEIGGTFIDPRRTMTLVDDSNKEALLSDDGFHPNSDGYTRLGESLSRALFAAGLPRGPERWAETGYATDEWVDFSDAHFG